MKTNNYKLQEKRNLVSFAATWNLLFYVNHKNLWTLLSKSYLIKFSMVH